MHELSALQELPLLLVGVLVAAEGLRVGEFSAAVLALVLLLRLAFIRGRERVGSVVVSCRRRRRRRFYVVFARDVEAEELDRVGLGIVINGGH